LSLHGGVLLPAGLRRRWFRQPEGLHRLLSIYTPFDLTSVTHEQVEETVRHPDRVDVGRKGRQVATRSLTERLVLRVVYREAEDAFEVVTFYPARRSRYETAVRQG
jgi:hypothetical protein